MSDWAKSIASKYFPEKPKAISDQERANATARRLLLDRDSERRWMKFRTAFEEAVKDVNETAGSRLIISDSPKVAEIRIQEANAKPIILGRYDSAEHAVTFTEPTAFLTRIYRLTVQPVNGVDTTVLLDTKSTIVEDDLSEVQRLMEQFLKVRNP